jgi:uncharacterized protein (DUF111 family)
LYTSSILRLLETNLDDLNPEIVPYVIDRLFAAGAKDAWSSPITMKAGRPGCLLSVLFAAEQEDAICEVVFAETSTLGVRLSNIERKELTRSFIEVQCEFGVVRIKVGNDLNGKTLNAAPEYKDCRELAEKHAVPLKEVYQSAICAFRCLPPASCC